VQALDHGCGTSFLCRFKIKQLLQIAALIQPRAVGTHDEGGSQGLQILDVPLAQ
jgi:hypothetical protein